MAAPAFIERLQAQVANEFAAPQQYIAVAVHYDAETLPRLAASFYQQALEERNHAMMMVQYLMDAGVDPAIPGRQRAADGLRRHRRAVALALEQERRVTDQIGALAGAARDAGDYQSEQFTQWFLKEQVEEVSSMSDLLRVVERSRDNPMWAEEYLARESPGGEGADPTAPPSPAARV